MDLKAGALVCSWGSLSRGKAAWDGGSGKPALPKSLDEADTRPEENLQEYRQLWGTPKLQDHK